MTRTTEQLAPENIAAHLDVLRTVLAEFSKLTAEQPTTAELEEALSLVPRFQATCDKALFLVAHDLRVWLSSRHLIGANAHMAAQFSETHPMGAAAFAGLRQMAAIRVYELPAVHPEVAAQMAALDQPAPLTEEDIASPELDEEFDRIERAHPEPGFNLDLRDLA